MEILVELIKVDTTDTMTGVVYPKSIVLHAIEEVEERIKNNNGILGEELPAIEEASAYINPAKASHVVKHIWLSGDTVMAKLKLVGKYKDMSETGISFDGFLRFFHSLGEDKVAADMITIITVDLLYREH